MYATGNKKMLNMLILELLKEYSDSDHRLTQQEIIRLLKVHYGMKCDRRSVKNNVILLQEMGYEIDMTEGYYLVVREFEDSELRMLIDSVLFSNNLTTNQANGLIAKLKKLGNKYFDVKVSHVCNLFELHHGDNNQVMYSVELLNDAISLQKKVSFIYNTYGKDFQLHQKNEKAYIINPYQMVANNGRYYLVGNYDKYSDISHYRIDKMSEVKILDENVKPMNELKDMRDEFSLPKHMAEHIYMFGGNSVQVTMWAKKTLINELVDWFGKDFKITKENEEDYMIKLKCNQKAMFFWALQYGLYVEVLEPSELRLQLQEAVSKMEKRYMNK